MHTFIRANEADGGTSVNIIKSILDEASPARPGDIVHKVFASIGLDFDLQSSVRVHPALNYTLGTTEGLGQFPALVVPLTDGAGQYRALELFYLNDDGSPAPVIENRQMYWVDDLEPGVFMAVQAAEDGVCGVACGLGEALAANYYTGVPMCAVCSPADLAAFQIPSGVNRLAIFANKKNAAEACSLQKRVRAMGIHAEIYEPSAPNPDWLSEFAFRGAFAVDDIASDAQQNQIANDGNDSQKGEL
jgi:hypothetical protein